MATTEGCKNCGCSVQEHQEPRHIDICGCERFETVS